MGSDMEETELSQIEEENSQMEEEEMPKPRGRPAGKQTPANDICVQRQKSVKIQIFKNASMKLDAMKEMKL